MTYRDSEQARNRRLAQAIDAGDVRGLSMGCLVQTPTCSVCDSIGATTCSVCGSAPPLAWSSVSMVPAPRCDSCKEAQVYLRTGTAWVCENPACEMRGRSVETGIGGILNSPKP